MGLGFLYGAGSQEVDFYIATRQVLHTLHAALADADNSAYVCGTTAPAFTGKV